MIKPLASLKEYPLNNELRSITSTQFENLKKDLTTNGQRESMLVTVDGVVLGGNHRLKAMRELGWTEVQVDEIKFVQEGEDWYAVRNGEINRQRSFKSLKQAEFQYAVWDNDPGYATYNKEALLKYADAFEVDYHDVRFVEEFSSLAQVEHVVAPIDTMPSDEKEKRYIVTITCAGEVQQRTTYDKLSSMGYNCKI